MAKAKKSKKPKKRGWLKWLALDNGYYDFNLVAVVILLTCFGLVMLYSTSAYVAEQDMGNDMWYFQKQALISAVSIVLALVISRSRKFDYHMLYYLSMAILVVSVILMFMVKYTPFGITVNGARRWLKIGPIQFQPSEIAKIAAVTYIPCMVMKMGRKIQTWKGALQVFLLGLVLGLITYRWTENLSTGLIIGAITVLMLFMVYPKSKVLIGIAIGLCVLFVAGRFLLQSMMASGGNLSESSFRINRVLVWLDPEQYSQNGGYQIMQALYAIGSGGFFGKGLGNSVQKLGPVPEAQNDMIFSIVCEELGVFGGLIVLALFGYLLYRLFFIAQNAPDFYGSMIVSGIFFHIALQVILNVCVVLNWIPTTGITLPFVSYGGTSILFLMIEMGIALSVSRQIKLREQTR